jgi:hypothetical protein
MFTAAVFTIAKLWNEPRCPITDNWIKKMWHMCTMGYYSAVKKKKLFHLQVNGWNCISSC